MKKIIVIGVVGLLLFISSFCQGAEEKYTNELEKYNTKNFFENSEIIITENIQTNGAFNGYTLIGQASRITERAKLIDMKGKLINIWFSLFPSMVI